MDKTARRRRALASPGSNLPPPTYKSPQDLGRSLVRLSHQRAGRSVSQATEVKAVLETSMRAVQRSRESIAYSDTLLARIWGHAPSDEQGDG
jgi:hypothetical protein